MPEIVEKEVKRASVLLGILSKVVYDFDSVTWRETVFVHFYGYG